MSTRKCYHISIELCGSHLEASEGIRVHGSYSIVGEIDGCDFRRSERVRRDVRKMIVLDGERKGGGKSGGQHRNAPEASGITFEKDARVHRMAVAR